jgi:UDP-N-acetylmuramyl pentapeptide phosphotransferase/UDP-N-acetylglucosamine-1-phosphate transferase
MSPALAVVAGGVFLLTAWLTHRLATPGSVLYVLDPPNERSLHSSPTPRTGGLAILAGIVAGVGGAVLAASFGLALPGLDTPGAPRAVAWGLGSTLFVAAVSLWDDRSGVPAAVRLTAHGVAAAAVMWGADLRVAALEMPGLGGFALGWLSIPLTILILMWMTNLYNFMDGMDGFAGGMTVLGFAFLSVLAAQHGSVSLTTLGPLVASAAAGFLVHNLPPARIFMGDVGSTSLGFLTGVLGLGGVRDGVFDIWAPTLVFSPFVVDATVTLVRRLSRGEKPWRAHRSHYYQRLVMAGWGHRRTMLAEYALMLASGLVALVYAQAAPAVWRGSLLVGWAMVLAGLAYGVARCEARAPARAETAG